MGYSPWDHKESDTTGVTERARNDPAIISRLNKCWFVFPMSQESKAVIDL